VLRIWEHDLAKAREPALLRRFSELFKKNLLT
jgi:hypothetical protein